MIRARAFSGRRVAVFGLGGSGIAAARALEAGGAEVVCWDDGETGRTRAAQAGLRIADLANTDWGSLAALILAPGVALTHPLPHWTVRRARAAQVEIIGDVEVFYRERADVCPDAPVIAITGTNGKSTTTALTTHLLKHLGCDVQMGGNIGKPVLELEPPARERVHVIEMSSYQIDLAPTLNPTVGVLLNVTPDHIERHGTIERYAAIKERLVREADTGAVCVDDGFTRAAAKRVASMGRLYAFTAGQGAAIVPRIYAIGTSIFEHETHGAYASSRQIASLEGIGSLRGRHNVQNVLAAVTALRALQDRLDELPASDLPEVWRPDDIAAGLASFPGLAHRMEEVGRAGRTLFVNDSKATNAEAAEKALSSFDRGIHWIIGGVAKEGGIASLRPFWGRVERAYLIGEAAVRLELELGNEVQVRHCGTLEAAISQAADDAAQSEAEEPVVLLSPACASFDQFANFEVRGDAFRDAVSRLPGFRPRASHDADQGDDEGTGGV